MCAYAQASAFTLRDLKASQLCAVVVDTLCNLHKFLSHEARDTRPDLFP